MTGVFGIFFPHNNSAYSAAMIFETVGLVIGSLLSINFCVNVKVYVYMILIFVSLLTYTILEIKTFQKKIFELEKKLDETERIFNP